MKPLVTSDKQDRIHSSAVWGLVDRMVKGSRFYTHILLRPEKSPVSFQISLNSSSHWIRFFFQVCYRMLLHLIIISAMEEALISNSAKYTVYIYVYLPKSISWGQGNLDFCSFWSYTNGVFPIGFQTRTIPDHVKQVPLTVKWEKFYKHFFKGPTVTLHLNLTL